MRIAPRHVGIVFACSIFAWSHRAVAQDTETTATALFDEGRKLMAQHHYADACPKLAESQRIAPSGGTLINLAECYEHGGQTASAWSTWKAAAARANAAGKASAEKSALARAAALEPSMARLAIVVAPESDVAGLEVKRDGVPVGRGEFGSVLPVDPGPHVIEATAPRKKAWSTRVDVAAKQTDARVTIALTADIDTTAPAPAPAATGDETAAPADVAPMPTHASGLGAQKTVAIVVGVAGVVGLAVGTIFGLEAKSKNDDALKDCRTPVLCSPAGLSLTDDARSAATVSTIAFAAGGAAVAAGAILWATAPSRASTSMGIRAIPVFARSYGGVAIDAAW